VLDKNNSWYCPACKAFKEAEMSQRIYSAPNILFVCLKRFKKSMSYGIVTSKLNTLVKFPLKRLDLTPFLHCGRRGSYDLIGVINHYGSIGGGHYTAFCFNEHEGWLEFDDSSVRKRTADDVNTAAAYVLVYRFRP
jgi:ubiquitin C-terminal hydrolase